MSTSLNLHDTARVFVEDLYPETPGRCITFKISDTAGNEVCLFLNDTQLRMVPLALQRYAATRSSPVPSYSEALFAPAPAEDPKSAPEFDEISF